MMENAFENDGKRSEVEQALDDVRRMTSERVVKEAELAEAPEMPPLEERARRESADLDAVRRSFEDVRDAFRERSSDDARSESLYGEFAGESRRGGRIVLEGEMASALASASAAFRKEAKLVSNLAVGERIAADYATKTNNFRSQTGIVEFPDGRRAYLLYDYPGSWVHRSLDGFMKRMNGIPMRKVGHGELKKRHAAMSAIPQIENGDPSMVAMPVVPNANAKDVFAHNRTVDRAEGESEKAYAERVIDDFASCDAWANSAGLSEKMDMAGKIMDELQRFHGTEVGRRGWGEATLSNVIFTEAQEPVMCDFEVKYGDEVPEAEARARDVKDMCMSVASALEAAHGQDVEETVRAMLARYDDADVIEEVKRLAAKKRGLLQNIFFGYEKARTGVSGKKQYDAVLAAIARYGS